MLFELYFGSKKKFWQRLDRIGSLYSTVYFIGLLIYHAASQERYHACIAGTRVRSFDLINRMPNS